MNKFLEGLSTALGNIGPTVLLLAAIILLTKLIMEDNPCTQFSSEPQLCGSDLRDGYTKE